MAEWGFVIGIFATGWAFGSWLMWEHFHRNDLIRTKEEWYALHPEYKPKTNEKDDSDT